MFRPQNLEPFAISNLFSSSAYALIRGDLFEVTLGTSTFGIYGLETLQRCYGVNTLPQSIPNPDLRTETISQLSFDSVTESHLSVKLP